MPTAWVVETIDILKERPLGFSACCPSMPPNQFCLQGFEEGFNCRVIIAVSFSAHRHLKALLAQYFSIGVTAILDAPVGMVNAARRWLAQVDRHLKGADREILFHAIADGPADHPP